MARELGSFLEKMDVQAELHRFVQNHKIKVSAEIEFVNKKPEPGPNESEEPTDAEDGEAGSAEESPIEWDVTIKSGSDEADPLEASESA